MTEPPIIPDYNYPPEMEENLKEIITLLKPLSDKEVAVLRSSLHLSYARGVSHGIYLVTSALNEVEEAKVQ